MACVPINSEVLAILWRDLLSPVTWWDLQASFFSNICWSYRWNIIPCLFWFHSVSASYLAPVGKRMFFFSLNNARLASDTGKNKELLFYQHSLCRIWPFCNFKQISKYQLCFSWVPLFVQLGSFWIKFHFSSFWIKEWSKEQSIPISFVKKFFFFFLTPQSPEILGGGGRLVNNKSNRFYLLRKWTNFREKDTFCFINSINTYFLNTFCVSHCGKCW